MFKAVHTPDNQEIIILDPEWEDVNKLNELRGLDRRDLFVCQECRQPVRVRAGEDRQWHFAHKHRQNCTYQSESAALLRARATLYRWLVEKFGANNVELEKKIDGKDVPRPVDCWVQGEKGLTTVQKTCARPPVSETCGSTAWVRQVEPENRSVSGYDP